MNIMKDSDLLIAISIIKFKNCSGNHYKEHPAKSWLFDKKIELEAADFIENNVIFDYPLFVGYLLEIEDELFLAAVVNQFSALQVLPDTKDLFEALPKLVRKKRFRGQLLELIHRLLTMNNIDTVPVLINLLFQSVEIPNTKNAYVEIFRTFKTRKLKDKSVNLTSYNLSNYQSHQLARFLIERLAKENISQELHEFIIASLLIITIN